MAAAACGWAAVGGSAPLCWHESCCCGQVVSALVGEIVLCTKEVNKKTRAAAFALLVDLARAMHEAVPIPLPPTGPADNAMGASAGVSGPARLTCSRARAPLWRSAWQAPPHTRLPAVSAAFTSVRAMLFTSLVFPAHLIALAGHAVHAHANTQGMRPPSNLPTSWPHAGEEAAQVQGGLPTLMAMVMGGLVATTPHMVSACVMALARLLFEFAGLLEQAAPRLLETVLMLLRSKSREVIKSVIGFCKVGAG